MHQIDLYLLIFLIFSIIVGSMRGLSGELGATLKFILTIFISYKVLELVNDKFDFAFMNHVLFPVAIYTTIYITTAFFLKFFMAQMVFMLKTIIPNFIDKPLGILLGVAKAVVILTILNIAILTMHHSLNMKHPKWLEGSKSEQYLLQTSIVFFELISEVEYDADNIGDNELLDSILSFRDKEKDDENDKKTDVFNDTKLNRSKKLEQIYRMVSPVDEEHVDKESGDATIDIDAVKTYKLDELINELEE